MSAAAQGSDKPRVLVVDDSRIVRASLGKHLKSVYELSEAGDGEAGWEALVADTSIRVVISDLSMPRLDGFGLIERIRASEDPRISTIPVIMVSGDDEAEPRRRATALGATAFITKGVGGGELLARLEALMKGEPAAPALAPAAASAPAPKPPAMPRITPPAGVPLEDRTVVIRATPPGEGPSPDALAAQKVREAAEAARAAQRQREEATDAANAARVAAVEATVSDSLTGLMTLNALIKQGAQLFAYARRHQLALSVMRIALDDFDNLRAKVGGAVADQILVGVGKLLSSRMRREDCVARTGAGEFTVALPAATRAGAGRLAERLGEEIRQAKIVWQGQALKITASIGVADTLSDGGESFADIYGRAAKRVDAARAQGGDTTVISEATDAPLPPGAVVPATPPASSGLSVDQALRMLAEGRGAEVETHVAELARLVYPLVKFCDQIFERAANRPTPVIQAAELLLLKTQPMETLKQQGLLE